MDVNVKTEVFSEEENEVDQTHDLEEGDWRREVKTEAEGEIEANSTVLQLKQ